MNMKEIQEMSDVAISEKLAELRREKLTLAIQNRTGQLEKSARIRQVRRDIARLLTIEAARKAAANS